MAALDLSALEIASGLVFESDRERFPLPEPAAGVTPADALEGAVLPALIRGRCVVAFSGGRDSTAVLGAAATAARRNGLPLPVPVTLRYPGRPETDESRWQERVVAALRLPDWERLEFGDELDVVGPVAQGVLRRHGLLWPPNTYPAAPMLECARGGTLLTGVDGDGLLAGWRWARPAAVAAGRARPEARDLLRIAHMLAPATVRRRYASRGFGAELSWLRPGARAQLAALVGDQEASEPRRFDRWAGWWRGLRYLSLTVRSLDLLAGDAQARVGHPLLDARVVAAVARAGGRLGLPERPLAMAQLFGALAPADVLARTDKPAFGSAFWGEPSREFARTWTGGGVPVELVDEAALARAWAAPQPDFRNALLMQSAWRASAIGSTLESPPVEVA